MRHVDFTDSSLTQDNFLVASTTESDQPANRFCYALDTRTSHLTSRIYIPMCEITKSEFVFGSPTRTVNRVALSL